MSVTSVILIAIAFTVLVLDVASEVWLRGSRPEQEAS
jgi:hypothetical protein